VELRWINTGCLFACLLVEKLMGIAALNPSYKVVLRHIKGYE